MSTKREEKCNEQYEKLSLVCFLSVVRSCHNSFYNTANATRSNFIIMHSTVSDIEIETVILLAYLSGI
jgi:hypothetical protein